MSAILNCSAWKSAICAPERLALEHVLARLVERRPGRAQRAGADVDAPAVEPAHGELEALAFRADAVGGRHLAVLEDHLPRRLRVPAHLLLVGAEREPRRVLHHREGRDAAGALVARAREHEIEVGGAGAGDELLGAVEDVVVARRAWPRS